MAKGSGNTRGSSSGAPRGLKGGATPIDSQISELNRANERLFREMENDPENRDYYEGQISDNDAMIDELESQRMQDRAIRAIERTGFKDESFGNWELDTPYGGAQILDETDSAGQVFGYKEYGVSVWDKDYNMIENGQRRESPRFSSLNEAKRYAKDMLKDLYK